MPIKVRSDRNTGSGSPLDYVLAGIQYAVENGANIISVSASGDYLDNRDGIFVAGLKAMFAK
jgi:hypothetical protein